MIPDTAVIVATYAVARLLCEYVVIGEKLEVIRVFIGIIAVVVIGVFLASILESAGSISDLNI